MENDGREADAYIAGLNLAQYTTFAPNVRQVMHPPAIFLSYNRQFGGKISVVSFRFFFFFDEPTNGRIS